MSAGIRPLTNRNRLALGALGGLALALGAACASPPAPRASDTAVDLVETFREAEHRPAGGVFELRPAAIEGRQRAAIAVPATSRAIWSLKIPANAALQTYLAAEHVCPTGAGSIEFRVGISDGRTYEPLITESVVASDPRVPRWVPVSVSLAAYGGFKWSLFYQPSRRILVDRIQHGAGSRRRGGVCASPALGRPRDRRQPIGRRLRVVGAAKRPSSAACACSHARRSAVGAVMTAFCRPSIVSPTPEGPAFARPKK